MLGRRLLSTHATAAASKRSILDAKSLASLLNVRDLEAFTFLSIFLPFFLTHIVFLSSFSH